VIGALAVAGVGGLLAWGLGQRREPQPASPTAVATPAALERPSPPPVAPTASATSPAPTVTPPAPVAAAPLPPAAAPVDAKALRPAVPVKGADAGPVATKPDHLHLAREAFNARDWPRALNEGKLAVAAGGGADAHAIIGNTYFKMGRFADAEAAFGKAVAQDPKNALLQERLELAHVRAQQEKSGKDN
jgi:hypothetical protein